MDFINTLSSGSKLEFTFVPYTASDSALWHDLWRQCEDANKKIDKKIFSVNKEKQKLRNVMKMIKIFNTLLDGGDNLTNNDVSQSNSQSSDMVKNEMHNVCAIEKECPKCDLLTEEISDLSDCLEIKNLLITKLQKDLKQVCVITRGDRQRHSLIPENVEDEPEVSSEQELQRKKLRNKAAKLKLQIQSELMKLLKEIPPYNSNLDAFGNADVFESNTEKHNLNNEQRNRLFKIWLPTYMSRRLVAPISAPIVEDDEIIHGTDKDRLQQLIKFTTGNENPTLDILENLKPTISEDPFSFLLRFEQAYRFVFNISDDECPASMIQVFVKKFNYLDPTSIAIASDMQTLEDAAAFIDKIRRECRHEGVKMNVSVVNMVNSKNIGRKERSHFIHPPSPPQEFKHTQMQNPRGHRFWNKESFHCFYCKKLGHFKRQCRKFLYNKKLYKWICLQFRSKCIY
ncbi:uncharacterized protein LOC128497653 [Spea bombifrons]|uniref:uncharacterized protein LOC128497653 n=1 Tax=Spea bombifrons TaxID=233779 RepID=UPI0023495D6E|nr:uncharacterized protein LOC128497653 [Spea bombifrons]